MDYCRLGKIIDPQGDVFTEDTPEHAADFANHLVHVQPARLNELAPAKGKQLPSERSRSLGSLTNLLRRAGRRAGQAGILPEQRRMAVDDGQNVVEIMSHAARQAA